MIPAKYEIHARFNPCSSLVELYVFVREGDRRDFVRMNPMAEPVDPTSFDVRPPSFTLDSASAQEMIDQLWKVGFRPTEGTGSAGALAATQKHLDDMRKIAFVQLKIPTNDRRDRDFTPAF